MSTSTTDTTPAVSAGLRRHPVRRLAPLVRLVRFVLVKTLVDPVRTGRLRSSGWPPGLRVVATVVVVLYVLLMLSAVFAGAFRRSDRLLFSPPDESLPSWGLPLLLLGTILALSCLFTAGLHLWVPARIAVTGITMAVLLYPVEWDDLAPADAVIIGLTAVLPLLVGLRWRSPFHWGELVVSLVVIGHALVVFQTWGLASLRAGTPDIQLSQLSRVTAPLWALAVPVAVLAGAALIEITTAAATWTATGVWQRVDRHRTRRTARWSGSVLVLLALARVVQEGRRLRDPGDPVQVRELLVGLVVAVLVLGACAGVTAIADRVPRGDAARRPDPEELLEVWSRYGWVLALVVGLGISGQLLASVVVRACGQVALARQVLDFGGTWITLASAVLSSLLALVAALVQAGRGRRLAPVLLITFALFFGTASMLDYLHVVTRTEDILTAVTAATVLLLGWLALRRRLTLEAQVALSGVLLVTLVYPYRSWLTEPVVALVSLTGVSAALLAGLLWRLLTDLGYARDDSAGFPQPSRVLLGLASSLVGVTSAAQVALLGGRADLDLAVAEQVGDSFLGFPLVLAVSFTGLALAAHGRDVR
ncbi:hypothetical protein [uncultured Friedmanniella sp.]|uniref:hypothetical protein n=1 Tax=uncultured Friedmanniella sp. TaxID=335381 RepID=UPI0035CA94DA